MSSPDNTIISLPGQSIVDATGTIWSIINGQVAVNGKVDASTKNVIQMAFEKGVVWQKNSANLWWGKATPAAAWGPPDGTSADPIPNQVASANGSVVTLLGTAPSGALTDASGNTWSIAVGRVTLNGVADASTGNVVELAYVNGRVWQENAGGLWWSKARPVDAWGPGAGTSVSPVRTVTHVWDGSAGTFEAAGHWSAGLPQSGDTAVVRSGDVSVAPTSAGGVNFALQGGEVDFLSAGATSIGRLSGTGAMQLGYPYQSAVVTTSGITMSGGNLAIREFFNSASKLVIHGDSTVSGGASLSTQLIGTASLPRGPLENDGIMTVNASTLAVGTLSGNGTVVAANNSSISVMGATAGETIDLRSAHLYVGGGPVPASTAMQFLAPVTNFGAASAVTLNNTEATREVFVKSAPTAGEVFLYNGSQMVADLHISGQAQVFAAYAPSGSSGSVTLTAYDTGHSLPMSAG